MKAAASIALKGSVPNSFFISDIWEKRRQNRPTRGHGKAGMEVEKNGEKQKLLHGVADGMHTTHRASFYPYSYDSVWLVNQTKQTHQLQTEDWRHGVKHPAWFHFSSNSVYFFTIYFYMHFPRVGEDTSTCSCCTAWKRVVEEEMSLYEKICESTVNWSIGAGLEGSQECVRERVCVCMCVRERLSVLIKVQTDAAERSKNSQRGLETAGSIPSNSFTCTEPHVAPTW